MAEDIGGDMFVHDTYPIINSHINQEEAPMIGEKSSLFLSTENWYEALLGSYKIDEMLSSSPWNSANERLPLSTA